MFELKKKQRMENPGKNLRIQLLTITKERGARPKEKGKPNETNDPIKALQKIRKDSVFHSC